MRKSGWPLRYLTKNPLSPVTGEKVLPVDAEGSTKNLWATYAVAGGCNGPYHEVLLHTVQPKEFYTELVAVRSRFAGPLGASEGRNETRNPGTPQ